MRILLVHNFYQQFGGEDAIALADRKLLESHHEEVMLYTRHNDEIKQYTFTDKILSGFQAIFSQRTVKEIMEIVRNFAPHIAYVHNVFPLISPSLYHTLHSQGVPIVQVIHDFRFLCPNGWFYTQGRICERCKHGNYLNAVRYRCYRNSHLLSALYSISIGLNRLAGVMKRIDAYVCLTEFSRWKLEEVGIPSEKIFIRPNYINASKIAPASGKGEYVAYLGRLSPEKGIWTLVRAFEEVEGVALRIAGTGPLEDGLRSYVHERGLSNIRLVGFVSGQEKWDFLKHSIFTVVPSEWYENFPIVILEAYGVAKPVIASNLGSLPYIVENGKSGLLFEPGNVDDLVEKVRYFSANPSEVERMGKHGRELVDSRYSPQAAYETIMTIFKEISRT